MEILLSNAWRDAQHVQHHTRAKIVNTVTLSKYLINLKSVSNAQETVRHVTLKAVSHVMRDFISMSI